MAQDHIRVGTQSMPLNDARLINMEALGYLCMGSDDP